MSSGRINSPASIRMATDVVRAFGGWQAVEQAAPVDPDGVRRISRAAIERARRERGTAG